MRNVGILLRHRITGLTAIWEKLALRGNSFLEKSCEDRGAMSQRRRQPEAGIEGTECEALSEPLEKV